MRVLIADDEPLALELLKLALQCIPEAQLVAIAKTGKEALALIRQFKPDVAILDIQMPAKSGFDVIESLRPGEHVPEIIFVTAFHEHAVRAFEVHAVDYLLKPATFDRVRESLRRAKARLEARASDERFAELQQLLQALKSNAAENKATYERELWASERGGLTKIDTASIDRVEAEGDYVRLHVGESSHLINDTIVSLSERLDPASFLRVHRSTIVNLDRVQALRRRRPRGVVLILSGGFTVTVGPNYTAEVLAQMSARRWRS